MALFKGLATLLTAVAAILSALVTIRGQWDLLFAQPSVGAAITVAATGSAPDLTMVRKSRVVQPTAPAPQPDDPQDFSIDNKSRVRK